MTQKNKRVRNCSNQTKCNSLHQQLTDLLSTSGIEGGVRRSDEEEEKFTRFVGSFSLTNVLLIIGDTSLSLSVSFEP